MKLAAIMAAGAVLGLTTAAYAGVELVKNGNFATGDFTDWTNSGYNFVEANGNVGFPPLWTDSTSGNGWNGLTASGTGNFAALDGDYNTGPISQTIDGLVAGQSYTVTFDYAFGQQYGFSGDTVQNLTVSLGGESYTTADYDLSSHGFSGWQDGSYTFTATAASETLSFLAYGSLPVPPFALVSNVSLEANVPEPSTWAMVIAGFGGLGYAAFRRRGKRTPPAFA
jgi:hypothetical protein